MAHKIVLFHMEKPDMAPKLNLICTNKALMSLALSSVLRKYKEWASAVQHLR